MVLILLIPLWLNGNQKTRENSSLDSLKADLRTAQGKQRVDMLNKIAYHHFYHNPKEHQKACLQHIKDALVLAKKEGYLKGESKAVWLQAMLYYIYKNHEKALIHFIRLETIQRQIKDTKNLITTQMLIGDIYVLKKPPPKKLRQIFSSLEAPGIPPQR